MIVVKVELWPGGDAEKAEPLGIVAIANRGLDHRTANDTDYFKYDVQLQSFQTGTTRRAPEVRNATVSHWRRRGWRTLVKRALEEVL